MQELKLLYFFLSLRENVWAGGPIEINLPDWIVQYGLERMKYLLRRNIYFLPSCCNYTSDSWQFVWRACCVQQAVITRLTASGPVCLSLAPVSTHFSWSSSAWHSSPARSWRTTAPSTTTRVFSPSCTCYPYFSSSTSSVTSCTSPPAAGPTLSLQLTSKWAELSVQDNEVTNSPLMLRVGWSTGASLTILTAK